MKQGPWLIGFTALSIVAGIVLARLTAPSPPVAHSANLEEAVASADYPWLERYLVDSFTTVPVETRLAYLRSTERSEFDGILEAMYKAHNESFCDLTPEEHAFLVLVVSRCARNMGDGIWAMLGFHSKYKDQQPIPKQTMIIWMAVAYHNLGIREGAADELHRYGKKSCA